MSRRRKRAEIARDRRRIADMYLQGKLQREIALEVGLSEATVSRDLKALHKQWQQEALADLNEAKARELARIDHLMRVYWEAWERSCGERVIGSRKEVLPGGEGSGGRTETSMRKEEMLGDKSFLTGVQWCIERRAKLLGLDAAERVQNLNIDLSTLPLDQLERIVDGEDILHVLATPGES